MKSKHLTAKQNFCSPSSVSQDSPFSWLDCAPVTVPRSDRAAHKRGLGFGFGGGLTVVGSRLVWEADLKCSCEHIAGWVLAEGQVLGLSVVHLGKPQTGFHPETRNPVRSFFQLSPVRFHVSEGGKTQLEAPSNRLFFFSPLFGFRLIRELIGI